MEEAVQQIVKYIKMILADEISKENNSRKVKQFFNTINDLIINNKELENIIYLEFVYKNNKIYIAKCSKSFCINRDKCNSNDCEISDFIGYNPDASEYLFKKMEEKINHAGPGYLDKNLLYDYIETYLKDNDNIFDVMIVKDHVIINEKIESKESGKIFDDYLLQSFKSSKTKKNNTKLEGNPGFIKSMWNNFKETKNFIQ